jgi:hypothetical protein
MEKKMIELDVSGWILPVSPDKIESVEPLALHDTGPGIIVAVCELRIVK